MAVKTPKPGIKKIPDWLENASAQVPLVLLDGSQSA